MDIFEHPCVCFVAAVVEGDVFQGDALRSDDADAVTVPRLVRGDDAAEGADREDRFGGWRVIGLGALGNDENEVIGISLRGLDGGDGKVAADFDLFRQGREKNQGAGNKKRQVEGFVGIIWHRSLLPASAI